MEASCISRTSLTKTSRVWNEYVDYVGMTSDPGTVSDGNLGEVHIEHENQGVYSLFSANTDAICIAWVTNSWSEERGGNKYAVSGDFGRECGGTWYASGMYPSDQSDHQPDCFWIDGNGDQPKTGFQVRWPAFSGQDWDDSNTDPQSFCNGIDFGLRDEPDPNTITYATKGATKEATSEKHKRRAAAAAASALRRRNAWVAEELVVSDSKSHSAQRLCESESSMGPDFVHTEEGLFCDMATKTLYEFCTEDKTEACYNPDTQAVVGAKVARSLPYKRVRDWRRGN